MADRLDSIGRRLGVARTVLITAVLEHEFPTDDLPAWWDEWNNRPDQPQLIDDDKESAMT